MEKPDYSASIALILSGRGPQKKTRTSFNLPVDDYRKFANYCKQKGLIQSDLMACLIRDINLVFEAEPDDLKTD